MCPVDLKEPLLNAGEDEPHIIVARTNNKDGSVTLKVTSSTTHPNGYTDVKLELYEVPESMSSSVDEESGMIPNEFLTRVEYRVLPPGTLEEDEADDNTVYTHMTQPKIYDKGCDASTVRVSNIRKRRCRDWKSVIFAGVLLVAAWALTAAIVTDLARESSARTPQQASPSSSAVTATATDTTTTAADELSNSNSTNIDNSQVHTDGMFFAPVTIAHLLKTQQRQYQFGVRGNSRR